MLIDAPGVEDVDPNSESTSGDIVLTDENADQILAMINRLNR